MDIRQIGKNLGVRHNVSFRVIDQTTGEVVSVHKGHNSATNSMLVGIGHYLKGDGVLNQGWAMLSEYVPKYISLGTMGLLNQEQDEEGLPAGIGEIDYTGMVYGSLSDEQLAGIKKTLIDGTELDVNIDVDGDGIIDAIAGDITPDPDTTGFTQVHGSDPISPDDCVLLRYIDYMTHTPGFGGDGYDPNQNNGRTLEGLGPMFADRAFGNKDVSDVEKNLKPFRECQGTYYSRCVVNHQFNIGGIQSAELTVQIILDELGFYELKVTNLVPEGSTWMKGTYMCDGTRIYLDTPQSKSVSYVQGIWNIFESDYSSWWMINNVSTNYVDYDSDGEFDKDEDGRLIIERTGTVTPMNYQGAKTINCELISPSFPRAEISYRDFVPEMEAEFPKTIDVIFSAMISTGALAQFREAGKNYVFITEAGLWSKKDWTSSGDNGLLAGYRIAPQNTKNWDMSKEENRKLLQQNIIKVGPNQVVQVIWKIQLGSIDQFEGIEALYPPENRPKWIEW